MKKETQLEGQIGRWIEAGLIDATAGERILAFEAGQERKAVLRWPVLVAMMLGGILLAAGIVLFVAAHWDELSPASRFSLVLFTVGILHVGGAMFAGRFPPLSTTLHAVGTIALGAAIFLTAQIFNLHENWATGVLLWALGAACGFALLRDWTQAGLLALLAPAWLISEWWITTDGYDGAQTPLAIGLILIAVSYLTARMGDERNRERRTLAWIGGIALLPCVGIALLIASEARSSLANQLASHHPGPVPLGIESVGWLVALAGPLTLAWLLRGRAAWMNFVAAGWAYALIASTAYVGSPASGSVNLSFGAVLARYGLCALGSAGLMAWGLHEKRKERLNLGVAGFAISVLFFYFDGFMAKLGRSESLLILGVLCLAGGYALEMTRRRLLARMETSS